MLTGRRAHLKSHSGHTMLALRCPRTHGTRAHCSSTCCWSGWPFHCQSPRRDAAGATNHLICRDTTCRLSKERATPTERMLARICREAGARVRYNAFLRDMNVHVPANDERRIEVLAQDLPCFGGAQLAVDITLRSVLGSSGEPQPHGSSVDSQEGQGGRLPQIGDVHALQARGCGD